MLLGTVFKPFYAMSGDKLGIYVVLHCKPASRVIKYL